MQDPGLLAVTAAAIAEEYVGVVEVGGQNRGEVVESFLARVNQPPGRAWCAAFARGCVELAAEHHGVDIDAVSRGFPDSGWTPAYKSWARRRGLWIQAGTAPAMRGDFALFYSEAKRRIAHVGIVVEPQAGDVVLTVEGNTRKPGQRDGVYQKRRTLKSIGRLGGFARLPF